MHQIRFQLGLHPRPSWGSLQQPLPDPLAGRELEEKGKEEVRKKEKEKGDKREQGREGKGSEDPLQSTFLAMSLNSLSVVFNLTQKCCVN